jgi:hypothetical protein
MRRDQCRRHRRPDQRRRRRGAGGTLAVTVSGNPGKVADLMPMFELWGKKIIIAGDQPGAAQAMKLANNMLYAVGLVATSEAMTMSGKAGIPADAMLQVLNNGTGRNFATMHLFPEAVFSTHFPFWRNHRDHREGCRSRHRPRRRTRRIDVGLPSGAASGARTARFIAQRSDRRGRDARPVICPRTY